MDELEEYIKSKYNVPENWTPYKWEKFPPYWVVLEPKDVQVVVNGAVFPPITKGVNKGKPNWRKKLKETERIFSISMDEFIKWKATKDNNE